MREASGRGRRYEVCILLLALSVLVLQATSCRRPEVPAEGGVIVAELVAGGAADRAGIEVGDRLLEWRRTQDPKSGSGAVEGSLETPMDLDRVEVAEAPRGPIVLRGRRGDRVLEFVLSPAQWLLESRPAFSGRDLETYLKAEDSLAAGELREGAEPWRSLVSRLAGRGRVGDAVWLAGEVSFALRKAGADAEAQQIHQEALELAVGYPALSWWAETRFADRLPPSAAARRFGELLASRAERDLFTAQAQQNLCMAQYRQSLAAETERDCAAAAELWERLAPGSLESFKNAILLAKIERNRGRVTEAVQRLSALLETVSTFDPRSRLHAEIVSELGLTWQTQGDLVAAQRWQAEALEISEHLGMREPMYAQIRMGLGTVAWRRGALEQAEAHFSSALEIFEEQRPGTAFVGWSLRGLALIAAERGDTARSESLVRRALEAHESAESRHDVALTLAQLASLVEERGELASAIDYAEQALSISQEVFPGSRGTADLLGDLGSLRAEVGDLEVARQLQRRGLGWYRDHAAGGISYAWHLLRSGETERLAGETEAAEALLLEALEIHRQLAPGSAREAIALHTVATLRRDQGRTGEAVGLLRQAIAALEAQKNRLGGTHQDTAAFAARHATIYKDLIDLLVELGEASEAFDVGEKYRAQGLLALLGQRDLVLTDEIPRELADRRRQLARDYEATQQKLGELDGRGDASEVAGLAERLESLRQERDAVAGEILAASPRYGRLAYPEALDSAGVARILDPGTLLLSYVVLPRRTLLFALASGDEAGPQVVSIALGEDALRRQVEALLYLLRSPGAAAARRGLDLRSEELYSQLVAPLAERITAAQRILTILGRPLARAAFRCLARPRRETRPTSRPTALCTTVVSATVYAELRERRGSRSSGRLAAFGDPTVSNSAASADQDSSTGAVSAAAPPTSSAVTLRSRSFSPLPAARAEVEAVAGLFPGASVFVGSEATESRVKALGSEARLLHFACHSSVDHRFPLDSFLALSPPEEGGGAENGFLQAWEIFEQLRLDADLVTLSACETGLGVEVGGEGLVGLTRAFQYAGARSIVASLWSVSDRSTSALMERFYLHLGSGLTQDVALQRAQLDLLERPIGVPNSRRQFWRAALSKPWRALLNVRSLKDWPERQIVDATHPYYWAAFQLNGDWQ